MTTTLERDFYTIGEVAARLSICRQKAVDLCRNKTIPCYKLGRPYRIPVQAFEEWLKKLNRGENPAA